LSDTSFFKTPTPLSLNDIASVLGEPVPDGADGAALIGNTRALDDAGPGDATFLDNPKYADNLSDCQASLIFCKKRYAAKVPAGTVAWVTPTPYHAYAKLAATLYPDAVGSVPMVAVGPNDTAIIRGRVHPTAKLEKNVVIEPNATVGEEAEIGSGTVVAAGAVVGRRVKIGRDCFIGANTVVQHALLGNRVALHSGTCVGQDGFGYAMGPSGHLKVPQIGRVIIQDDVEIGANTCIDRGTNRDTIVGEGTKIDNQVQIGHNVAIGRHCVLVGQVAIAGSATLGDFVVIGGQTGVIGHVTVGDGAQIAGVSAVHGDVPPGARWGGVPAKPLREWFKEVTALNQLAKREIVVVEKTDSESGKS
jgi:UDP-3-O-[3-hydroxymyristoyl] glucosamine N-acyltransferase